MFEEYALTCRLDEIMREKKIATYEALSAMTGVSYNAARRVAHGETKGIDFETLKRLCLGLGVSPSDLFAIDVRNENNALTSQ